MTTFMAMKIHYDHRKSLPTYLKYSKLPSKQDFDEVYDLYENEDIGGKGFHECLNFAIRGNEKVKIYVPATTCIPSLDKLDDEFVIFSFTYKQDKEQPSSIIGVHASAFFNEPVTIMRDDFVVEGIEALCYQATSPAELTTLFTTPIKYDFTANVHTPSYVAWGNGQRYIGKNHAQNILKEAYVNALEKLQQDISLVEKSIVDRELQVLERIYSKFFDGPITKELRKEASHCINDFNLPDTSISQQGEQLIYDREIAYVESLGLPVTEVEWLSQAVPNSVFDIKSIREINGRIEEHYIEVKSSKLSLGDSVHLSSRQLVFFKENQQISSISFVNYDTAEPQITNFTYSELIAKFDLVPTKFKLKAK